MADTKNTDIFSQKKLSSISGLNPRLIKHMEEKMKIEFATKIQSKSFPVLLALKDALIRSETGSGKTLAYSVPLVNDLAKTRMTRKSGVKALILAPTRELCLQIYAVMQKLLGAFIWIVPGVFMGGEKKKSEKSRLRKGINILIATPGRCLDHLKNTECLNSETLSWLVLDEADRLLDMGFESKIREIISLLDSGKTNTERHNVLVSATLTKSLENVANLALKNPVYVAISNESAENVDLKDKNDIYRDCDLAIKDFKIPKNIHQEWIEVEESKRLTTLISLVMLLTVKENAKKVIIFVSTCSEVDFYYNFFLRLQNFFGIIQKDTPKFFELHGDMGQKDRTAVYYKFMAISKAVLICTDIAARGLDLPMVDLIIQFNAPISPIEYIHRIGRTARLNKKGRAILFLIPSELDFLKILKEQNQSLQKLSAFYFFNGLCEILKQKKFFKNANCNEKLTEEFLQTKVYSITADEEMRKRGEEAYRSFIKSYATFPKPLKPIFHPKRLNQSLISKGFGLKLYSGKRKQTGKNPKFSSKNHFSKKNYTNPENQKMSYKSPKFTFKKNKETTKVFDYRKLLAKSASFASSEFAS